jgi:hypothetical protein
MMKAWGLLREQERIAENLTRASSGDSVSKYIIYDVIEKVLAICENKRSDAAGGDEGV